MTKRAREYLEIAKQHGFKVTPIGISGKSMRVSVESDGITFETRMPMTPSHSNGARNFVQNLRRLRDRARSVPSNH